jgi:REP element-mobilizing transposase RayT
MSAESRRAEKSSSSRNPSVGRSSIRWGSAMKRARQRQFEFRSHGGPRPGAGRKPNGDTAGVPHAKRAPLAARHPVHVTLKLAPGIESLRKRRTHAVVRTALAAGSARFGLRLVEYAVLSNHVHLVCEAADALALSRGIKGLAVRIARALNRALARAGSVFADRFHARALKTPREVRNALNYVLKNAAHHGIHFAGPDPCSSGAWFEGWSQAHTAARITASPLPRARTWLLTIGWRRHGLIASTPRVDRRVLNSMDREQPANTAGSLLTR